MKLIRIIGVIIATITISLCIVSSVSAKDLSRPPRIISYGTPYPELPALLTNQDINPIIIADLYLDDKGLVKGAYLEESSGYAPYDEAIIKLLENSVFEPALGEDWKSVESTVTMSIFIRLY